MKVTPLVALASVASAHILLPRQADTAVLDFGDVLAAPAPASTGPTGVAPQQPASVNPTSLSASGSAAATAVATVGSNSKRGLEERTSTPWYCAYFPSLCPSTTTTSTRPCTTTTAKTSSSSVKSTAAPITTTSSSVKTSSASTTSAAKTTSSSASSSSSLVITSSLTLSTVVSVSSSLPTCASTTYTPYYPAVTTGTYTQYQTPTATTGSATACPTQPEDGTYCGFINPEDDCAPQPDGYGPVPSPDNVDTFEAFSAFHQAAADAVTPSGYTKVFTDYNASVSNPGYLGLYTYQTYSPAQCAAQCDCTDSCSSFNVFIERDPSVAPAAACPNPPSMTSYKCTLFAAQISAADATNDGQYRNDFHIVIVASNGYTKISANSGSTTPSSSSSSSSSVASSTSLASSSSSSTKASTVTSTPTSTPTPSTNGTGSYPGWGTKQPCPGGAINNPSKHMGGHFFPGPFDVRVCAGYADAQNAKNRAAVAVGQSYTPCNMFNAFAVHQNGRYKGLWCALFTDHADAKAELGTYTGGVSGGQQFTVGWSWLQAHSSASWDSGVRTY